MFSAAAAAASVTSHSKKSAGSDCATPLSKKDKTGDDLFDVDSDPDLAPGRFFLLSRCHRHLGK